MRIKDCIIENRSVTDFGNWNGLWEDLKDVELDQEVVQNENQIHESIDMEEVQQDAASFFLGRY